MAILGNFKLIGYKLNESGQIVCEFQNDNPGGGNPSQYFIAIPEPELPTNISQPQLAITLKKYLGLTINQTHGPLNTAVAAGLVVVQP